MSADGTLGEELPRNVQDLLQAYFRAKNTTKVPEETYCIQSPRVHTTTDGKRVTYISQTIENVEVRAYTLPSMSKYKKCGEKLLVATGRSFPVPIVLARTKPHSNTFRQWLGAADDGTGAPVVTRHIPNRGHKVENRKRKSSISTDRTTRRKAIKMEDEEASIGASEELVDDGDFVNDDYIAVPDESERTLTDAAARELAERMITRRAGNDPLENTVDEEEGEDDDAKSTKQYPKALSQVTQARTPVLKALRGSSYFNEPRKHSAGDKGRSTTSARAPGSTMISCGLSPQITPTVAEHTTFYFVSALTGEKVRKRALAKIDNVEVLFAHAYAADVIPMDRRGKKLAALEVRVGDVGEAIRIVDDEDFGDLVDAIVREDCWEQGVGCEVYVTGLGGQGADTA